MDQRMSGPGSVISFELVSDEPSVMRAFLGAALAEVPVRAWHHEAELVALGV